MNSLNSGNTVFPDRAPRQDARRITVTVWSGAPGTGARKMCELTPVAMAAWHQTMPHRVS